MLSIFALAFLTVIVMKIIKVSLFWTDKGIPYEPLYKYLYRGIWSANRRPLVEVLRDATESYGTIFGTYRGFTPTLSIADVELSKEVLIKQFDNFFNRSFEFTTGDPLWDNNVFHLAYGDWKNIRTAMGLAFTTSKMKGMVQKFDRISKRLVKKLEKDLHESKNYVGDFKLYWKTYSVDSITAIAYGIDGNCVENPDSKLLQFSSTVIKPGPTVILFFMAPDLIKYVPFVHFPPKETSEFFGKLGKEILKEKKKHLDEAIANGTTDIIDNHLIIQRDDPSSKLTDEILAAQAYLFIVAGLDTTSFTLQLATYCLACFPETQQKSFNEIKEIMGDRKEVTYEDVQKFKYLEALIYESLRCSPTGAIIDRKCSKDTKIGHLEVKKGWYVEFNTGHMHANAKYFPEPRKFKPERFLKGTDLAEQQELSAFLIFGDGPKNCVGKRLAIMNTQTVLANLILRFQFEKTANTPSFPFKAKPGFNPNDVFVEPLEVRIVPRHE